MHFHHDSLGVLGTVVKDSFEQVNYELLGGLVIIVKDNFVPGNVAGYGLSGRLGTFDGLNQFGSPSWCSNTVQQYGRFGVDL